MSSIKFCSSLKGIRYITERGVLFLESNVVKYRLKGLDVLRSQKVRVKPDFVKVGGTLQVKYLTSSYNLRNFYL